jgi:ketosteroid isomerase-like protein
MAMHPDRAERPEDLTTMFVARANERDAAGLAALYEPEAAMAYPPGSTTRGRAAIEQLFRQMLTKAARFEVENSLPPLLAGDLALCSTRRRDGTGLRVQVARRQTDGSWLRVLDWPEPPAS